jgi:iron complex outermembrane recepter protein
MQRSVRACLLASLVCVAGGRGASAAELSEQDYFSELPTVLTVSRLAQPLGETPGAVTIIDRDTIRRSGARELVDVLRLVPGYIVGGWNGANPLAAYHAPIDDKGSRNLVLIDGRPVYSAFYLGDTHRGMMGVQLEDIERIEVLRGSNSAAYGANAMFGVINIITRHTADTHGVEISVTGGNGGVNDQRARIGWGSETASFRLSTGRRSDNGYFNAYDDKVVSQLHIRGDIRPAADQELMLASGITQLATGDGFPGDVGNPTRTINWRNFYLHGVWQRQLSGTEQVKLTANFDEEHLDDAYVHASDPSVTISTSGRGRRLNLELQHQLGISDQLRAVWGMGYKYEEALSPALYARYDAVSSHEERLFGNLEWRPHTQWLINAGAFWGNHSWTGEYFSPRLMANFLATPDHSFRIGVTESARTPTLFELAGDLRLYPKNVLGLPLPFTFSNPPRFSELFPWFAYFGMPIRAYAATGKVGPEKLYSEEVGYFGNFRDWRLTADVRGYVERMRGLIDSDSTRTIPGYVLPFSTIPLGPDLPIPVTDFVNSGGLIIHGLEYQLRWKPLTNTEIWVNQSFERMSWDGAVAKPNANLPPSRATTLALFQKLPLNLDLSLMYHSIGKMSWGGAAKDVLPASHRLDARLAFPFRIGSTKAEAAFTVQAADGGNPEYLLSRNFSSERRAYGTLRLEF